MKKLLIKLALFAVPVLAVAQTAADLQKALPSDWGGWQNLTYGVTDSTSFTTSLFKMETEIVGQNIHLLWQENGKDADGKYRLYYRRSTDLGQSWEQAKLIGTSPEKYDNYNHLMSISGNNVYIFCPSIHTNEDIVMRYARSTDGGGSFTTHDLQQFSNGTSSQFSVASEGQTVVFAYRHTDGTGWKELRAYTSTDGGANFTMNRWGPVDNWGEHRIYPSYQYIADLQVTDGKWLMLCWDEGKIQINRSDDGGQTVSLLDVNQTGRGEFTYWSSMPGYRQQMLIQGNTIDVIYNDILNDGDEKKIVHQRSTDLGKTWGEPQYLPDSYESGTMTIAGKGDNLYVMGYRWTGENGRWGRVTHRTLWYSHDGGKTWQQQRRCLDTYELNNSSFQITIAPDDASGKHVLVTGEQGFFMETKDGFSTVERNFRIGDQSWEYRDRNNQTLQVLFDEKGDEHWFMQYSQPYGASWDSYFWNICHRLVERPAEGDKEMAYHITNTTNNGIIIPMSPSIQATSEAITVEAWVRFDNPVGTFSFASLNNNTDNLGAASGHDGWFLEVYYQEGGWTPGGFAFNGNIHAEKSDGSSMFTPWRYLIRELGQWHHVAITYDSNLPQDNVHFYIDGLPYTTATETGKILMGNNPILIGLHNANEPDRDVLIDNFALYSRALTLDEIHSHIYGKPDPNDKDCRLLLTFDGTLRDQSQYHNDPVPLMPNPLVAHDGINTPNADFTLTKDTKGTTVYANDITPDGEMYWWFKPTKDIGKYNESTKKHESVDFSGNSGNYTFWMVAKGNGVETNAFAPVSKDFTISGLSKVIPDKAGQGEWAKLRIQGGYKLNSSTKPRVVLKQGNTEIEGSWDLSSGYNSDEVNSFAELAAASFNLENAPVGKYDVIVGTDSLLQAFTVEEGEVPDVWMSIDSRYLMLWNRYQTFTINYGNRSNVAAYNVPMFLLIPDRKGAVDVTFLFEYELCNSELDEYGQQIARQLGDYLMGYDERTKDSVRVYSFMIPYIGPNSSNQYAFRMRVKGDGGLDYDAIKMWYWLEEPWGPYDPDAPNPYDQHAPRRAPFTLEQGECFAKAMGIATLETAISFVPGLNCLYGAGKTIYQLADKEQRTASNFMCNFVSTMFSCVSGPASILGHVAFNLASGICNATAAGISASPCLKKDPQSRTNRGVSSIDPNEMIGPWGPDDQKHFIQPIHQMPYTITFENKSTASAPANEVFVTDSLDLTKFDAESFSFTGFGWADTTFVVGSGQIKEFTRDVIYKVNNHEILVRVSGEFKPESGIVNWSFVSLEKDGNELDDVMNGFLLPNDATGRGEGFVNFTIEHIAYPVSGSSISNKATIIFDGNKPITTNTYVNTFDSDYPTSKVKSVEEKDGKLVITIEGSDPTSGVDHYTLYAFKNGSSEATVLANNVTDNTVTVDAEPDTKYGLCAIATDRVGLNEPKDVKAEVEITTSGDVGIDVIKNDKTNDKYTDLQGRQIDKPTQPGIYLHNGRKVIIK